MKRLVIILFIINFQSGLIAQPAYQPMNLTLDCYWVNHYKVYDPGIVCEGDIVTYYEKDTIINTHNYQKLKSIIIQETTSCSSFYTIFKNSIIYLREDTILHEIFHLYSSSLNEIPFINYNLNVNDIIQECSPYSIIDSISYSSVNNIVRKSQWFNIPTIGTSRTIEGIGRTINFPICIESDMWFTILELKCFKNNGQFLYTKTPSDSCNISIPLATKYNEEKKCTIQYFNNQLILNSEKTNYSYKILSMEGKLLYASYYNQHQQKIDLSSILPDGIYIAVITSEKENYIQKCIVNKF
jgi:hypothetical protein